jgi:uncharacterized membrane protein YqjE
MDIEFFTLRWWLSVVVVGLLINLASAYIKPVLDAVLGFLSVRELNQQIKRAEGEMDQLDNYAKSEKAILVLGFKSLFALLAIVSLMAVMLIAIQPAPDLLMVLTILTLVVVAAISIVLAGLLQQVSEYPKSRERIEKKIAELKRRLPGAG